MGVFPIRSGATGLTTCRVVRSTIVMEPLTLLYRSRSEHYDKSARKQGDGLYPLGKTRLHCGQKIRYTHMSIAPEIGEARVVRRRGVPRCRRKGVCPLG